MGSAFVFLTALANNAVTMAVVVHAVHALRAIIARLGFVSRNASQTVLANTAVLMGVGGRVGNVLKTITAL
jgi:hypothetical protein